MKLVDETVVLRAVATSIGKKKIATLDHVIKNLHLKGLLT